MPVSDDDGWDEADGWNVAACPRSSGHSTSRAR